MTLNLTRTPGQVYVDDTPPQKSHIVTMLNEMIAGIGAGDVMAHRPGDNPTGYQLNGAMPGDSAFGKAIIAESQIRINGPLVALEPGTALEYRASFFRTVNSQDPDNNAVQVGIQWFNAAKEVISGQPVITRTGLSVSTGRIEVLRVIGAGLPTGDLFLAPPVGAVYCRIWIQFYGVGHRTGSDILMLRTIPSWVKDALNVRAEGVFTPDGDFEWPENWIPETRIERAYTTDPAFEFPSAWIPGEVITGTIFVDYDGGQDAGRDGRSWKNRVKTLERAAELATLYASEGQNGGQWTVVMSSTTHYTNGELAMPDNCYVRGMGTPRSTTVRPNAGYEVSNVFLMGSGGGTRRASTRAAGGSMTWRTRPRGSRWPCGLARCSRGPSGSTGSSPSAMHRLASSRAA
ncbi:MAG: hypothetical protein ACK41Y_06015 [Paracoccus hibiscisoli]|uniref:hypothetical protein n=1 Tax=Paracoccus hibiscisoli TaxID=2023261 RepID=UPI00391BD920